MLGSVYLYGHILMTHLIPFCSNINPGSVVLNPATQENTSLLTYLKQRVSDAPYAHILSHLGWWDLLQLRTVSKLNSEESAELKLLTSQFVKFCVSPSEACVRAMDTSYLSLGWRSIVFQRDLDFYQMRDSLGLIADCIVRHGVIIEDLTIDLDKIFSFDHKLDNELFDDESGVKQFVDMAAVKNLGYSYEVFDQLCTLFQPYLTSLDIAASTSASSQLLTTLLQQCASLKNLNLAEHLDFISWFESLDEQARYRLFHAVETLDLSFRRSTYFDESLPPYILKNVLKSCHSLKSLTLGGGRAISDVVSELTEDDINQIFGQVFELNLYETDITPDALKSILSCDPPLRYLTLHGCNELTDLSPSLSVYKNLEHLDLTGVGIKSDQLNSLLASCQNLRQLYLSGCWESLDKMTLFTPDQLNIVFGQVRVLVLGGTYIRKEALRAVLLFCHSLNYLDLNVCQELPAVLASLTDEQIRSIFGHLWHLGLSGIHEKDPLQLCRLLGQSEQLTELSLKDSTWGLAFFMNLDADSLTVLLGKLRYLIFDKEQLSREVLEKVKMALPSLCFRYI